MLRRVFSSLPSTSRNGRHLAPKAPKGNNLAPTSARSRPQRKIEAPPAFQCLASGAAVAVVYYVTLGNKLFKDLQDGVCTEGEVQRWWHFKRPFSTEGVVTITPIFVESRGEMNAMIFAKVEMDLDKKCLSKDSQQICNWLNQHGVETDGTEEGARLGLTNYLLQKLNDGVSKHVERRCNCMVGAPPIAATNTEMTTTEPTNVRNADF